MCHYWIQNIPFVYVFKSLYHSPHCVQHFLVSDNLESCYQPVLTLENCTMHCDECKESVCHVVVEVWSPL